MGDLDIYDKFEDFQRIVAKNYYQSYDNYRKAAESWQYIHYLYPKLMVFWWFLFVIIHIMSIIPLQPNVAVRMSIDPSQTAPGLLPNIYFGMGYILVGIGMTFFIPLEIYKKVVWNKYPDIILKVCKFIFITMFIPITAAITSDIVDAMLNIDPISQHMLSAAFVAILGFNFFAFILGLLISHVVTQYSSANVISITSNIISNNEGLLGRNYDRFIRNTLDTSYPYISTWSKTDVKEVGSLAEDKYTSILSQVQAISPIFGTVSLVGLLTLLFNQEQIIIIFDQVDDIMSEIFATSIKGVGTGIIITLLLLAVLMGCRYFLRIYQALRILEILKIICNIRLIRLEREREEAEIQHLLYQLVMNG